VDLTVVGAGRIGHVFAEGARRAGGQVALVTREEGRAAIEEPGGEGPIVVAVREEHLPDLVPRIHASQGPRLVFVQNGFIGEWMDRAGATGRGLLHFNAAKDGTVRVLLPSVFGGGEAAREAGLVLEQGGIPARYEPDMDRLRIEVIRKALWSCVLSILAAWKRVPVGELFRRFGAEVEALTRECAEVSAAVFAVEVDVSDLLDSLRKMASALPDYGGSSGARDFRSLWIVRNARERGLRTPVNDRMLRELGERE
jgi:ketopantoate reductase